MKLALSRGTISGNWAQEWQIIIQLTELLQAFYRNFMILWSVSQPIPALYVPSKIVASSWVVFEILKFESTRDNRSRKAKFFRVPLDLLPHENVNSIMPRASETSVIKVWPVEPLQHWQNVKFLPRFKWKGEKWSHHAKELGFQL